MPTNLNNYILIALAALLALPLFAFAQVNFPAGLESCGAGGGALSGGIGSSRPLGGPFVPVADYAVELNTATLVYKECVVTATINRQKKAAAALIVTDTVNKFMTQRDGGPMYPVILERDILNRQNGALVRGLEDSTLEPLNPTFRNVVRGAVALSYRVDTRVRNNTIACPEPNINTVSRAQDFSFGLLWREADPRCQPLYAYYGSKEIMRQDIANDNAEMMYRLSASNGIYGVEAVDENGNRMTLTPGIFVQQNTTQALQAGFNMLMIADDLGEITDALFASMADQAMTGRGGQSTSQGLASLTGGLPGGLGSGQSATNTYLDRVLRNQFGGGGGGGSTTTPGLLTTLQGLLATETQYLNTVTTEGNLLIRTNTSLASSSILCWGSATKGEEAFVPYASRIVPTASKMNDSQEAVTRLRALIAALQSSNPPSTQQVQQQLGALTIHTNQQLQTEITNLQSWSTELYPTLVQNTVDAWMTPPSSPAVGCQMVPVS